MFEICEFYLNELVLLMNMMNHDVIYILLAQYDMSMICLGYNCLHNISVYYAYYYELEL